MGNEQSNTRTKNYKKVKITDIKRRTESGENWLCSWVHKFVDFELDEYISYNNGNEKWIDFKDQSTLQVAQFFVSAVTSAPTIAETPFLYKGDYIRVDMNYTKEFSSGHEFSAGSITKVGFERIDSDGKISIFGVVAGVARDIYEARRRYLEQSQYNRWLAQIESSTSYNLPPK